MGGMETTRPGVSVVVPVLNQADELEQQLSALVEQSCDEAFEIVVADNGSRDRSREVARTWAARDSRIRTIDASQRRGAAAARNIAVAKSHGSVVAFCDADDLVLPGWLQALVSGVRGSDVGLVSGAFDFALLNGGAPGIVRSYTAHFGFLPAGLGANLAVRREVFERLAGFDEALIAGEDIDLCWRAQLSGFRLAEVPAAIVAKRERSNPAGRRAQLMSYGRHDVELFLRYRDHGMPRNARLTTKTYLWLLLNAPRTLWDRRCRSRWTRAFFVRLGRVRGSLAGRVMYL